MRKITFFVTVLAFLTAAAAAAAPPPPPPGAVPLDELGIFPREKLSVEINLTAPLLRLVSAATRGEDPELSSLLSSLKEIRVRVFPLEPADEATVRSRIGRTVQWLEDHGWAATVKVREKNEETFIYLKESDGDIQGLTLLSVDAGVEAVLINIVGRMDPAQLGRLGRQLDIPRLEKKP